MKTNKIKSQKEPENVTYIKEINIIGYTIYILIIASIIATLFFWGLLKC